MLEVKFFPRQFDLLVSICVCVPCVYMYIHAGISVTVYVWHPKHIFESSIPLFSIGSRSISIELVIKLLLLALSPHDLPHMLTDLSSFNMADAIYNIPYFFYR